MRDGLYRVHFQTPLGWGSGVVVASGGRLWGGDAGMYYTGTYKADGQALTAAVTTNRHTHSPGIVSVFGRDQVRITLSGIIDGDSVRLRGTSTEVPDVSFAAELSRLSD